MRTSQVELGPSHVSWDVLEVASVPSGEGTLRPSYVSWDVLEVATVPSGVGILQGPSQLLTLANQHHPNSCNRPNSQHCPNSTWGATSISTSQPVGLPSIRDSHNFQARTFQLPALASSQLNSCKRPTPHFPTPLGTVATSNSPRPNSYWCPIHLGRSQLSSQNVPTPGLQVNFHPNYSTVV